MGPTAVNNAAINGGGAQGGAAGGAGSGAGNAGLNQAFDTAIQQAQQTLEISTRRGADLYALKQRPQSDAN